MSIGGIGGTNVSGMDSTRNANALANVSSAAFSTLVSAGTASAGSFSGPAASAAVSSLRGLGGNPNSNGDVSRAVADISASNIANIQNAARNLAAAQDLAVAQRGGVGSAPGFGGNANSGGDISQATGDINASNKSNLSAAASENAQAQSFQVDMFRLQNAINTQSQTNNLISNMQKARHDAAMATIQNTR